jgi:hypothetical protein
MRIIPRFAPDEKIDIGLIRGRTKSKNTGCIKCGYNMYLYFISDDKVKSMAFAIKNNIEVKGQLICPSCFENYACVY